MTPSPQLSFLGGASVHSEQSAPWSEPTTSREAARMIAPTAGTLRAAVLAFIEGCGSAGACEFEMSAALGISGDTTRPRLRELEDAGHIVKSQERRATPSGRDARVWKLSGAK